jgi:hypothetical protein
VRMLASLCVLALGDLLIFRQGSHCVCFRVVCRASQTSTVGQGNERRFCAGLSISTQGRCQMMILGKMLPLNFNTASMNNNNRRNGGFGGGGGFGGPSPQTFGTFGAASSSSFSFGNNYNSGQARALANASNTNQAVKHGDTIAFEFQIDGKSPPGNLMGAFGSQPNGGYITAYLNGKKLFGGSAPLGGMFTGNRKTRLCAEAMHGSKVQLTLLTLPKQNRDGVAGLESKG